MYNEFSTIFEQVVQDRVAEDDQRHGVAHVIKFLSFCDLHENSRDNVHLMCWYITGVAMQFLPTITTHYSG